MIIDKLELKPKQKFLYLFDYGDEHELEVEVVEVRPDAPPAVIQSWSKAEKKLRSNIRSNKIIAT